MKLLGLDRDSARELEAIAGRVALATGCPAPVERFALDVEFARDPRRNQCYATKLLERLANESKGELVAVTAEDLFVPVFRFVFGEAQLGGRVAVVSSFRLREVFYGQTPNRELERNRLLKCVLHEWGHVRGLRHCENWECAMHSAHAVERIDLKLPDYCPACSHGARGC